MKILALLFLLIAIAFPSLAQHLPPGNDLMVGYYGRPNTKTMGILGEYSIDDLVPKLKAKAAEYAKVSGKKQVTPAFHLIYGMATTDPGRDKDYLLPLSDEKVMAYIKAAQEHGFAVILDTQLGANSPAEAVKPLLKYLKHDNVHMAIDPEFSVEGRSIRPGKVIGSIEGKEINAAQQVMLDYMKEHDITGDRMLIVHNFTEHMVTEKERVKKHDGISLVMNLDGHGSPELKVKTYNGMYTDEIKQTGAGGFKLFYKHEKATLMTPRQVLGMDPVSNDRIERPPEYINYQ